MEQSLYDTVSCVAEQHWWRRGKLAILEKILMSLGLGNDASILEAGCGVGGYLPLLAEFGTVKAFEPSDFASPHLGKHEGIAEITTGALPYDIPFGDERFDLVAAFDVLEHVEDDKAALRELAKRLESGGWLLLTVPAYQWLWTRSGDELQHHFRRYTKSNLCQTCLDAGFEVMHATYFNSFLFIPAVCARLVDKITGGEVSQIGENLPCYNELFRRVFAWERFFLPKPGFPFGLSVLVLARIQST